MAKIFLTGASGYIGGDFLHQLLISHPEYRVKALLRDASKGAAITNAFSQVEIVKGSLDDVDIIAQEARDADIVVHLAATGHLPSVEAIHTTLANRPIFGKSLYWIQMGGGSVLAASEVADKSRIPGAGSNVVFDNLSGIKAIRSLIKKHPSRTVDNYMLSVAERATHVKIAHVPAPNIYGPGRGTGNQRSVQMPELAKVTLQRKGGLQVGEGLSTWGNVHVRDLSRLFVLLVERAVKGYEDYRVWGENGIYPAASGEMSFGEISRRVVEAANDLGLLSCKDMERVSGEEADKLLPHGSVLFGTNARSRPLREEEILGWKPQEKGLEHEIVRVVAAEAQALGLLTA